MNRLLLGVSMKNRLLGLATDRFIDSKHVKNNTFCLHKTLDIELDHLTSIAFEGVDK